MTQRNALFSGADVNLAGPEWALLARLLDEQLVKRRQDLENLALNEHDRLIVLGRVAELKDILAMPEVARRRAKILEGNLASYE